MFHRCEELFYANVWWLVREAWLCAALSRNAVTFWERRYVWYPDRLWSGTRSGQEREVISDG